MKNPQYPSYPTEKNADLLDLIIKTSSNTNSFVLDCFSGSGTKLKSAQLLGRKWIGIDQSEQAIKVSTEKLERIVADIFTPKPAYEQIKCEASATKTTNRPCKDAITLLKPDNARTS
jgi:adenine-specific DNA-methyltransferase